jgi:ribosome-binding protein aMBF1 (putative translation factor)
MKAGVKMAKAGVKFNEVHHRLMKDEEFKLEYEKLKPRYDLIAQIIDARSKQNITQEELALRVGTQKSNISRFESGSYNPSLDFVTKLARCLDMEINITLNGKTKSDDKMGFSNCVAENDTVYSS